MVRLALFVACLLLLAVGIAFAPAVENPSPAYEEPLAIASLALGFGGLLVLWVWRAWDVRN